MEMMTRHQVMKRMIIDATRLKNACGGLNVKVWESVIQLLTSLHDNTKVSEQDKR